MLLHLKQTIREHKTKKISRCTEKQEQHFLFFSKIMNSEFLFISFHIGYNTAIALVSLKSSPQAIPTLEN